MGDPDAALEIGLGLVGSVNPAKEICKTTKIPIKVGDAGRFGDLESRGGVKKTS